SEQNRAFMDLALRMCLERQAANQRGPIALADVGPKLPALGGAPYWNPNRAMARALDALQRIGLIKLLGKSIFRFFARTGDHDLGERLFAQTWRWVASRVTFPQT